MAAAPMNSSGDYKHRIGNPRRNFHNNRPLVSYASDNYAMASFLAGGSCGGGGGPMYMPPSSISVCRRQQNDQNRRQQPPLLPFPVSMPLNHQNMSLIRSNSTSNYITQQSSPPINKKIKNRSRDHFLTPKKSKNQKKHTKREVVDLLSSTEAPPEKSLSDASVNRIGPDPMDLPKEVFPRVLSSSMNDLSDIISAKFSGSAVFITSPPPSSLPLPTFSLRPKLSCNTEAAATSGVNTGATGSLRRLLRLGDSM